MWLIGLRKRDDEGELQQRPIGLPERTRGRVRPGGGARPPASSVRARAAAPPRPWPDPRRLTSRQMQELSHRLYLAGRLDLDESRLLSCQPELHPDYATSVARLTGRPPAVDVPRDHIEDWQRRLAFALRYTPDEDERIGRIRRIIAVLIRLAPSSPASLCRARE